MDIPSKDTGESISGYVSGGMCLGYDGETKTALLVITSWGQVMADDLSDSAVYLFNLRGFSDNAYQQIWENSDGTAFPVEIEPIPSLVADAEFATAFQAEEVRLSNLGLSVIFQDDGRWEQFSGTDVRARLADGTLVEAPWEGGQGSFGNHVTGNGRKVLVCNFHESVDLDQVVGIYMNEEYFPIK